jgi:hypothetical protein
MNRKEMDARAAAGLPAYGEPTMDETAQAAAARNSKFAALKFGMLSLPPPLCFSLLGLTCMC